MMTFDEVHTAYSPFVRAAIGKRVPAADRADVESVTWISIWTALRNFEGRSSIKTFIYPIVRRRIADYHRGAYQERRAVLAAREKLQEDSRPPMPEDPATVLPTPAEIRVLRLLAEGRGNEDLARELCLSRNTVRSHLKSLYKKLKFRNRGELCIFAHRFLRGES